MLEYGWEQSQNQKNRRDPKSGDRATFVCEKGSRITVRLILICLTGLLGSNGSSTRVEEEGNLGVQKGYGMLMVGISSQVLIEWTLE